MKFTETSWRVISDNEPAQALAEFMPNALYGAISGHPNSNCKSVLHVQKVIVNERHRPSGTKARLKRGTFRVSDRHHVNSDGFERGRCPISWILGREIAVRDGMPSGCSLVLRTGPEETDR